MNEPIVTEGRWVEWGVGEQMLFVKYTKEIKFKL